MARRIQGRITDSGSGDPIEGVVVQALDNDGRRSDFMGDDVTDRDGRYAIQYARGAWDLQFSTAYGWRPDIQIRAYMRNKYHLWEKVGQSRVYRDQVTQNNRTINLSVVQPAINRHTAWGTITYRDTGQPAAGVRVSAYDADVGNPFAQQPDVLTPTDRPAGLRPEIQVHEADDFMGTATTDASGYYEIPYRAEHWDPAPHWNTVWRPDIYITVSGKAPGSRFTQGLGVSPVFDNVRHRTGVRIDLAVARPIRAQEIATAVADAELRHLTRVMTGESTPEEARLAAMREIFEIRARDAEDVSVFDDNPQSDN